MPIDDTGNMRFDFVYNRVKPINKELYDQRMGNFVGPDGKEWRKLANRYFQDRKLMETENYTGMGHSFNIHDAYASETQGPIHDRTRENLATSDRIIVRARRQLLEAIKDVQDGKDPRGVVRDPASNDCSELIVMSEVIPATVDHKEFWKTKIIRRAAAE